MNTERELLRELAGKLKIAYSEDYDSTRALIDKVQEELAKPEPQNPLTNDEVVGYLKKSQLDYLNASKHDCIELYGTRGEDYEIPVYLSPQKRYPLIDAEIEDNLNPISTCYDFDCGFKAGVDFAEKHHSIEL